MYSVYGLWVFHLIWGSDGPGECCLRAQGRARWPTHGCSVNPHLFKLPPPAYSTVVSGTQRLFSGSQSTEEWETAALHAPKSLHDFLIGGSGLCVQRLESGPHCQSSAPRRDQIPPTWISGLSKQSGMEAVDGWRLEVREGKSWQWKRAVCRWEGCMVEGSQKGMFVKEERIDMKLLREGIAPAPK